MTATAMPLECLVEKASSQKQGSLNMIMRALMIACTFSFTSNLFQLALPLYSMQIFDRVLPSDSLPTLLSLSLIMILLTVSTVIIEAARTMVLSRLAYRIDSALHRYAVTRTLDGAGNGCSSVRDIDAIRIFIVSPFATALLDAPWSCAFVIAIFLLHPLLGWMAVLASVMMLSVGLLGYFVTTQSRIAAQTMATRESELLNAANKNGKFSGRLGASARLTERVLSLRGESLKSNLTAVDRQGWVDSSSRGLRNVVQVCVLGLAAYLVVCRGLPTGAIVASSMLFSRALGPVERLGAGWPSIVAFTHSFRRAIELTKSSRPELVPMALPRIKGAVELQDVCLVALSQKRFALRQISLTLKANELMIVVGKEGSGKTALGRILGGALIPTSGDVRLDGSCIEDFGREALAAQVGYAAPDIQFVPESVGSFIARGMTIEPAEVVRAAELARVHDVVQRLPNGYNTDLSLDQQIVSAGAKQRLILARAFYNSPPLLILDEPTFHIDDDGERMLLEAIRHLKAAGSTIIVISRLPGLLHLADRLLMLDAGEIKMAASQPDIYNFIAPRLASTRP